MSNASWIHYEDGSIAYVDYEDSKYTVTRRLDGVSGQGVSRLQLIAEFKAAHALYKKRKRS